MSLPADRTMPVMVAKWNGKTWRIQMPGGITKSADTRGGIERIVARDACGAAIRFVGRDTKGQPK